MLLINALEGAAADLTGNVSPRKYLTLILTNLLVGGVSVPVFKTNTDSFISLREVVPMISLDALRNLKDLFPEEGL